MRTWRNIIKESFQNQLVQFAYHMNKSWCQKGSKWSIQSCKIWYLYTNNPDLQVESFIPHFPFFASNHHLFRGHTSFREGITKVNQSFLHFGIKITIIWSTHMDLYSNLVSSGSKIPQPPPPLKFNELIPKNCYSFWASMSNLEVYPPCN